MNELLNAVDDIIQWHKHLLELAKENPLSGDFMHWLFTQNHYIEQLIDVKERLEAEND